MQDHKIEVTNQTGLQMAEALKELMKKQSLDKISVKDIVTLSGYTRQTFYRHFPDKYGLVNWYFEILVQDSFREMETKSTLRESLIKKFRFIAKERYFFQEAFQSKDYNSLIEYDYQYILKFYTDVIIQKTGKSLSPEIDFLLKMYCKGSIAMTVDWTVNHSAISIEQIADLLVDALPKRLNDLLHFV